MAEFIYPLRIYYEDTDFNGFVYFANYLKYMERAATQSLANCNLRAVELSKMNALIAVRSVQCQYFRPAHLDDDIEVVSRVRSFSQVMITWDHTIRSQANKEIVHCHGVIERLCINRQLQPITLPAPLLAALQQLG